MVESGQQRGQPCSLAAQSNEIAYPGEMVAALREQGGYRMDPVRFHFIEALARRAQEYQGPARRILDARLARALTDYAERFEQAQNEARGTVTRAAAQHPDAASDLERLFNAGDFGGLRRFIANLKRNDQTPLADLAAYIAQHSPVDQDGAPAANIAARGQPATELKSLRYFRTSWSKLSVEQQLSQALAQEPENAGPLNSHLLVLRSLKLMRDISPDYLHQFMSYVDTLLWLDQADNVGTPTKKVSQPTKAAGIKPTISPDS